MQNSRRYIFGLILVGILLASSASYFYLHPAPSLGDEYKWDGLSFRLPKGTNVTENIQQPNTPIFQAVSVFPTGSSICKPPLLQESNSDCKPGFTISFYPYQKNFMFVNGDGPDPFLKKTPYEGISQAYMCHSKDCNAEAHDGGDVAYQIQFGEKKWYLLYDSSDQPYEMGTRLKNILSSIHPLPIDEVQAPTSTELVVPMNSQIVMQGNDIYFSGIKRGEIVGQKVSLDLGEDVRVTFPGKFGDFQYSGHGLPEEADATIIHAVSVKLDPASENSVSISDFVTAPYQSDDLVALVRYRCDGSLVKGGGGKDVPNYYCETNGKDFLSQYEFSTAGTSSFATGDAPWIGWYKLYIKKAGSKNIFIFMELGPENGLGEYGTDEISIHSKKSFLDTLLAKPDIAKRIVQADTFVKNLSVRVK